MYIYMCVCVHIYKSLINIMSILHDIIQGDTYNKLIYGF